MSHTTRTAAKAGRRRRTAFSMIELVIVVVIIGIIAAIAIPRMSRGAAGAADSALKQNLAILRNALDLYAAEHGNAYPTGTAADVVSALTMYTKADGTDANVAKDEATSRIYGPYLRKIPAGSVLGTKGKTGIAVVGGAAAGTGDAWIYNPLDGSITPNIATGVMDAAGNEYVKY